MRKFIILIATVFGMSIAANAANYAMDDAAIDALCDAAVEAPSAFASQAPVSAAVSNKSEAAVLILNFFLGEFGIHRHYMGTAKWMWAAYTFTFGGIFGVLPIVDFIVEIVDLVEGKGLSNYYGCTKFIMWI